MVKRLLQKRELKGIDMEWYGLIANGRLIAVQEFDRIPDQYDFSMGYCSWIDYRIVAIDPVILDILPNENRKDYIS